MDEPMPRVPGRPRARRARLSRSADFERAYRRGRSHANRHLVVHAFPRSHEASSGEARLGLSVSRRIGGAVERNRVKRLLREAFAAEADVVPRGHDIVIVARPDVCELARREGLAGVRGALRELLERTGAR